MGSLTAQVALVGVLVVLNGALAGSELALVSLRQGQLQRLEQQSDTGRLLARLARDPNRFLATIQIGITLAGFLASAAAAVSLAEPLVEPLSFLGRAAEPVAIVVITLFLSYVTLVLGELAPKRIAMQRAERWALVAARPLALLAVVSRPVVWLLGRSTDLVVRLLGSDPSRQREEVTQEELRDMVVTQVGFGADHRTIISEAFDVADRCLRQIVVPRTQVLSIEAELSCPEALRQLVDSGHSRAPVVAGELDNVVGVVHLRDLVAAEGRAGSRARPGLVLPETVGVVDALRQMQQQRQQLAIVVNEHGGTEGIVTLEDLLEEIVGEIYDETDRDVAAVRLDDDGSLVLPGAFPIHDLPDLGVKLPEGPYTTVSGLVLERLGHIPDGPGEAVVIDGSRIEVVAVEGRAITRVRLSPFTASGEPASAGGEGS
ncbi:MAG: hemolysin family protein [Actinomycetota bacterium]|nr:hemolysin family protein [Actinomycetota bacterium]